MTKKISAHTHRYVPSPGDSITHVRCEVCDLVTTHVAMLRAGNHLHCDALVWTFFCAAWASIARREVFRTSGLRIMIDTGAL
jgi:hypothetical protein